MKTFYQLSKTKSGKLYFTGSIVAETKPQNCGKYLWVDTKNEAENLTHH